MSRAVWYFLRQSNISAELIVVDDGEDKIGDLIPQDTRITYLRSEQRLDHASRMALAGTRINGTYVAEWRDDAWYSPDRLVSQVERLEVSGGDAVGLRDLYHYDTSSGRAWLYDAPMSEGSHWLWRRDRPQPGSVANEGIAVQDGSSLAVSILHGGTARPPNPLNPRWREAHVTDVQGVLGLDVEFYTRRGDNAAQASKSLEPVTVAGSYMVYDGFGSMAEYLALGIARAGADVRIAPFRLDAAGTTTEFQELVAKSPPASYGTVLCHSWWGENLSPFRSARDLFIKTVWEYSRLPADWPARLNQARAVIVPSEFCRRVFIECGVTVPVEVVHEGIDPQVYSYQERPQLKGLTTLIVGVLTPRKNIPLGIEAWQQAFAGDPDARLLIKSRFNLDKYALDDPRISVVDSNETSRGIAHWYAQADVLLCLGNEGFGLPLIEGMATGLPVIALDSEAQADVCAEARGFVLPVRPERWDPVDGPGFGPAGVRAIPSVADAARQLRWVASHRDEAREMGRLASAWAHEHRNVWRMGPGVLDVMQRYSRSPRPLRSEQVVWSPPRDAAPFVTMYANDLAQAIKARLVCGESPEWRAGQMTNLQYVPGVWDPGELEASLGLAVSKGVTVLATEHSAAARMEAWHHHVAAVAVPTDAGRERIRHYGKRTEMLHYACPSWRETTRPAGGRTVAVITLDDNGGFDTELELLFIGAGPRATRLPISGEALAELLAERADVCLLPEALDSEPAFEYLAGAALASGVPVVAARSNAIAAFSDAVLAAEDPVTACSRVLTDGTLRRTLLSAAKAYCDSHGWQEAAARYRGLWQTV